MLLMRQDPLGGQRQSKHKQSRLASGGISNQQPGGIVMATATRTKVIGHPSTQEQPRSDYSPAAVQLLRDILTHLPMAAARRQSFERELVPSPRFDTMPVCARTLLSGRGRQHSVRIHGLHVVA